MFLWLVLLYFKMYTKYFVWLETVKKIVFSLTRCASVDQTVGDRPWQNYWSDQSRDYLASSCWWKTFWNAQTRLTLIMWVWSKLLELWRKLWRKCSQSCVLRNSHCCVSQCCFHFCIPIVVCIFVFPVLFPFLCSQCCVHFCVPSAAFTVPCVSSVIIIIIACVPVSGVPGHVFPVPCVNNAKCCQCLVSILSNVPSWFYISFIKKGIVSKVNTKQFCQKSLPHLCDSLGWHLAFTTVM